MEETKEVVSCSNTGLIQVISLIFLQEGNKKALHVQPEKALAQITVNRTLGTVCGAIQEHILTVMAETCPQALLFSQRMESAFCQRQKQGYDLVSLYFKELWEKTKGIDKGMVSH